MKNLKSFMSLVIVLFMSNMAVAQKAKTNQKAVIKTAITCDHCKQCETCGVLFQDKLIKINGVKMIDLDVEKMMITVFFNATKTNLMEIKTAISKLGYDADEIKADPAGYDQLDACCKI